jgi:Fe-S-cluster containining protein
MISAEVEFVVGGTTARAQLTVSSGAVPLSELLPACRSISEVIVSRAVEQVEGKGQTISCRAGCGACCRQIVPVSEPEARVLARIVDTMEEPRRSAVRKRFEEARKRLQDAGLADRLSPTAEFTPDEATPFAAEYFRLGIPCPFLANESCSIYEERPVICREYLVTNDPKHCEDPRPDTIRLVPMAALVSSALIQIGVPAGAKRTRWVPLPMALDWVADHPVEECESTGPALVEEFFKRLAQTGQNPGNVLPSTEQATAD